jgi:hypothetical protein
MALYPLSLVLKTLSVKAHNVNEHKPSQHVGEIKENQNVTNIISPPSSVGRAQGP